MPWKPREGPGKTPPHPLPRANPRKLGSWTGAAWGSWTEGVKRPQPGLGKGCPHLCRRPFPVPPMLQAQRGTGQSASPTAGRPPLLHPGGWRPQRHLPGSRPGQVTRPCSSCRLQPKGAHRKGVLQGLRPTKSARAWGGRGPSRQVLIKGTGPLAAAWGPGGDARFAEQPALCFTASPSNGSRSGESPASLATRPCEWPGLDARPGLELGHPLLPSPRGAALPHRADLGAQRPLRQYCQDPKEVRASLVLGFTALNCPEQAFLYHP